MQCPACQHDLIEIESNKVTKDITYECENCHEKVVMSTIPDDEVIPDECRPSNVSA